MQIASQLKGSKRKSNIKHSEINQERNWTAGKSAHPCGAIASESGDLALNYQARFNGGAVWRGMPCAELHWGLVGDRSVAAGSVWLLLAMLGHALVTAW